MSNFLLKDPECVLIHIPKTGGSTIRHGIWKSDYEGPTFGSIPSGWSRYFKFAFVRHPLDRLVSAFEDFRQYRKFEGDIDAFLAVVMDESVIYDERRKSIEERIRHHAIPQTHPFNCLADADFVGRYENYLADLESILKRVGKVPDEIPAIRKTKREGWESYLAGETLKKAIAYFEADFETLGYAKP